MKGEYRAKLQEKEVIAHNLQQHNMNVLNIAYWKCKTRGNKGNPIVFQETIRVKEIKNSQENAYVLPVCVCFEFVTEGRFSQILCHNKAISTTAVQ